MDWYIKYRKHTKKWWYLMVPPNSDPKTANGLKWWLAGWFIEFSVATLPGGFLTWDGPINRNNCKKNSTAFRDILGIAGRLPQWVFSTGWLQPRADVQSCPLPWTYSSDARRRRCSWSGTAGPHCQTSRTIRPQARHSNLPGKAFSCCIGLKSPRRIKKIKK